MDGYRLYVGQDNPSAQALYKKEGFKISDQAYFMEKEKIMCKEWLLKTERLLIKPLEEDLYRAFHDYHSLEAVFSYQGFQPSTYKETLDYIESYRAHDHCILAVMDLSEEILLGDITLTFIKMGQVEIGYSFDPKFQKQGYAYEACKRVLNHLFIKLGIHRVYATLVPENKASEKLLIGLNFRKEGHYIKSVWTGKKWLDDMVYALLNEEYIKEIER